MKLIRASIFALAAGAAMNTAPVAVGQAQAQDTLFGILFDNNPRPRRVIRDRDYEVRRGTSNNTSASTQRAPAPKIKKIAGPRYYDYSAQPLQEVTIASILPGTASISSLEPSLDAEARRFSESLPHAPETRLRLEKEIADVLKDYYAENPGFLWSRGNAATPKAKAVAELMKDADTQGLVVRDYAVAVPPDGWSMDEPVHRMAEMMEFEITMSAHVLRYALDVKNGVVNPNKLSGYHDFPAKDRLTAEAAMAGLADEANPAEWLKSLEPQQPAYAALQRELAMLEDAADVDEVVIADGTFVRPGQSEPEMPNIIKALKRKASEETREKHLAVFTDYDGGLEYTPERVALLRDFQKDNGLKVDGIIGRNTLRYLSDDSQKSKIERVKFAMERLRWLPEEFGPRHVFINQPAFRATYSEDYQDTLSMRAIVGSPSNQTYFFYDEIETVVYNPYWGVPQSIIVNEMLPKLRNDASYLDRNGYVVTTTSGTQIASSNINWWQYSGKVPYNVRQKPGPSNALGELKILFPNSHAIYMHDTPSRNLFSRDMRALSHGCVRLQQPREMAAAVLGTDVSHIVSNLGGSEHRESLPSKVPVFVSYFTAWPTDAGEVEFFDDIYSRDEHLGEALTAVRKSRDSADA